MKPFYVYMLRCADGSYYVGHTDDLARRVASHQAGEIAGYTHERRPVELAWAQEAATREEALAAEQRIKGWSRAKKEALMAGDWEKVRLLARSRGAGGLRQAQPERGEEEVRAGLRQAQPERGEEEVHAGLRQARPERGEEEVRAGLRQARPERDADRFPPVRPEPVEGPHDTLPPAGRAPATEPHDPPLPVRPEPVEGPLHDTLPPAGRASAIEPHDPSMPVRPEPVEGPHGTPPPLRAEPAAHPPATPDPALVQGILQGHRRPIAKAITLLESTRRDHRLRADALLNALVPHTGRALRLGISGVPGVGKSTFIETLGLHVIERGHKVAVLTIDPSSTVSGGSILGDKTRMERLSVHERAYIRPSPSAGTLGGVAEKTREAMLVCEAAGYDVVIVETVGVGQSETAVAGMTDMFVLLQLPNAGDDLQAIKKGVMELADLVVVNKADLDPDAATRAQATLTSAMRLLSFHGHAAHGAPPVIQISALRGQGVDAFWQQVERFRDERRASGAFEARRRQQALAWMWELIHARLQSDFRHHPAVRAALAGTQRDVADARIAPSSAAHQLLDLFQRH